MARPRPVPIAPTPADDPNEFGKLRDFQTRAGGPREFARLTAGSKQIGGKSQVKTPEPG
jgi:hypothetical protein